jgi:2-isopropylmalate synthase
VGRGYDPIIRVHRQSGSSSAAYILEANFKMELSKPIQRDFGSIVTASSAARNAELSPQEIFDLFSETYINISSPYEFVSRESYTQNGDNHKLTCLLKHENAELKISGEGRGVIHAFCQAFEQQTGLKFDVGHYSQFTMDEAEGAIAPAITYVEIVAGGKSVFGAGRSRSTTNSSLKAVVSAINRL